MMNTFDNDELDSVEIPASATAHNPKAAQAAPAPTAPAAGPADDDISFDDEDIAEAVKAEDFLPTIKINKGEVARFSFVPEFKLKHARVHYVEGQGTFLCVSTKEAKQVCCHKGGNAKDRYVGLVYRYENVDPKTGKFVTGATKPVVSVQAVRLSRANMRDLLDSCEDGQSVYDLDVRMRHDESRAFGYKFSKAASKPTWKSVAAEVTPMLEPYKDGSRLASRLGKKLNAVELNAILHAGQQSADSKQSMETMLSTLEEEN